MSGKTVNSAILLLVIGNALALISDVFIKFLQADAPVFQYAFLRCVITLALLLPFWRQLDTGNLFAGGRLHFIRRQEEAVATLSRRQRGRNGGEGLDGGASAGGSGGDDVVGLRGRHEEEGRGSFRARRRWHCCCCEEQQCSRQENHREPGGAR